MNHIDSMIDSLEKSGTPAEYIIMGKGYFFEWIIELTKRGEIRLEEKTKKYKFSHRGVKIILCESEILEVVPNAKYILD